MFTCKDSKSLVKQLEIFIEASNKIFDAQTNNKWFEL